MLEMQMTIKIDMKLYFFAAFINFPKQAVIEICKQDILCKRCRQDVDPTSYKIAMSTM